jgi:hypothetical protein
MGVSQCHISLAYQAQRFGGSVIRRARRPAESAVMLISRLPLPAIYANYGHVATDE